MSQVRTTNSEGGFDPLDVSRFTARVLGSGLGASVLLGIGLAYVTVRFRGEAIGAHLADSAVDVLVAATLLFAHRVSTMPPDRSHPIGHHQAEPVAALGVAVVAGGVGVEVVVGALDALVTGQRPDVAPLVLFALGAKGIVKGAFAVVARRGPRTPALHAFEVDARNDALLGLGSMLGVWASQFWVPLDSILAVITAGWVILNGFDLARDNVRLLMGQSAAPETIAELAGVVREVPGVVDVGRLAAFCRGPALEVSVEILVDEQLSLREAHAIEIRVRDALEIEPRVMRATVHLDVPSTLERAGS